jgi:hypothetical protein
LQKDEEEKKEDAAAARVVANASARLIITGLHFRSTGSETALFTLRTMWRLPESGLPPGMGWVGGYE